jgi:hypothetical protein
MRRNDDVTRWRHEIGAAMRRALDESPALAECLARIKAEGYELSVVLEAQIGILRRDGGATRTATALSGRSAPQRRPAMTPLDRKFLRSIQIAVDED